MAFLLWHILFVAALSAVFIGGQYTRLSPETPSDAALSLHATFFMMGMTLLAFVFWLLAMWRKKTWLHEMARLSQFMATVLAGSIVLTTVWETHRMLEIGHWGMSNLYEVSILLFFFIGLFGALLERGMKKPAFGTAISLVLLANAGFIFWLWRIGQAGHRELLPALQSIWLPWHVAANFIGYAAFAVAGVAGALELLRLRADERGKTSMLPSAALLDQTHHRAVMIGFPMFSIAILLGCVWAYEAWGGYWSWDPKETWALIVWLIYGGYLHARHTHLVRGKALALWTMIGFIATLFCYLGVNMFLDGMHSYGALQ